MANQVHLEILRQGVNAWNRWVKDRAYEDPGFTGADLRDIDLSGLDLCGINLRHADLSRARLCRTLLSGEMTDLSGAKLNGADLSEADLSFANLSDADFSAANLTTARLFGVRLDQTRFVEAKAVEANFSSAEGASADFSQAHMNNSFLLDAQLPQAHFSGADLSEADLRWTNLSGATFTKAHLRAAMLRAADLSNADLRGADLSHADLRDTNRAAANLEGANLDGAQLESTAGTVARRELEEVIDIINPEPFSQAATDSEFNDIPEIPRDRGERAFERTRTVWYATNRQPLAPDHPEKGYSGEYDKQVHYGTCTVSIPDSHLIGKLNEGVINKIRSLFGSSDEQVKVDERRHMKETEYWQSVNAEIARQEDEQRHVLIYIHGFNVSFDEAALRAAQIGDDLRIPGLTAFYSWPSKGSATPLSYVADEDSIIASEDFIADFLINFALESGAEKVHILAHSMGNRGLLRALKTILSVAPNNGTIRYGQIILAAADVSQKVFARQSAWCTEMVSNGYADGASLYISSQDRALKASGLIHSNDRVGLYPPPAVFKGMDTIEVSSIDLSRLGHGYFSGARDVLNDLHQLITTKKPPRERFSLREAQYQLSQYWRIAG